jgi:hypothetical protein
MGVVVLNQLKCEYRVEIEGVNHSIKAYLVLITVFPTSFRLGKIVLHLSQRYKLQF